MRPGRTPARLLGLLVAVLEPEVGAVVLHREANGLVKLEVDAVAQRFEGCVVEGGGGGEGRDGDGDVREGHFGGGGWC